MKIAVIGSGYVGLVAGAGFAMTGNTVRNVDKDETKIKKLNEGEIPIFEPGLDVLVQRNVREGRLTFSTDVEEAIAWSKIIFIAVGTPSADDGSADLSAVDAVAKTIADNIDGYTIVVLKSTVPIGTNERVTKIISSRTKERFAVVSNPEFLKEGDAVSDFMKPNRVVLGTNDPEARETMRRLYLPLQRTGERIYLMDPRSAEVVKYVSNAYLAHLDTYSECIGQHLDKLSEIHSLVGDVVEDRLGLVTLVLHIPNFHIQLKVVGDLSGP